MTRKRIVYLIVFGVVVAAALGVPSRLEADTHCVTYLHSRATYFPGYGLVCAYTGTACTQCWDPGNGGSCVIDGIDTCLPKPPLNQIP
jgi:hypothetical protein